MSRPVWLTEAEVHGYELGIVELAALVRERWDAAPADAEKAAEQVMLRPRWSADDVLRALGKPKR